MPEDKNSLIAFLVIIIVVLLFGVFKWMPERYEQQHQYEHHMTREQKQFERDKWEYEQEYNEKYGPDQYTP